MEIIRGKEGLKEAIRRLKAVGKTIGLVPTMGALHAGHISLVEIVKREADIVVVSIFVNPTQFGPNGDLSKYPRTEAEDIRKLERVGAAIAYIPTTEEIYPQGFITRVQVPGISNELCGAFRPGHFDGVATVVTKLFMQAMPDVAVFGEKDYQQLHIIRQFTRDLDIPVKIIGAPIMREADGLAMSSRNRYLSEKERVTSASLYRVLMETAENLKEAKEITAALAQAKKALLEAGFTKIDYIELRDAETLAAAVGLAKPARLLAVAWLGVTRLIDNIAVSRKRSCAMEALTEQ
jgi:pantoate--beta-alanine ligase